MLEALTNVFVLLTKSSYHHMMLLVILSRPNCRHMQHLLKEIDRLERNVFLCSGIHKVTFGVTSRNSVYCLFMVLPLTLTNLNQ